ERDSLLICSDQFPYGLVRPPTVRAGQIVPQSRELPIVKRQRIQSPIGIQTHAGQVPNQRRMIKTCCRQQPTSWRKSERHNIRAVPLLAPSPLQPARCLPPTNARAPSSDGNGFAVG